MDKKNPSYLRKIETSIKIETKFTMETKGYNGKTKINTHHLKSTPLIAMWGCKKLWENPKNESFNKYYDLPVKNA